MYTGSLVTAAAVALAVLGCQNEPTAPRAEMLLALTGRLHAHSKAGSMSYGLTLGRGTVRRASDTSSLTLGGMVPSWN